MERRHERFGHLSSYRPAVEEQQSRVQLVLEQNVCSTLVAWMTPSTRRLIQDCPGFSQALLVALCQHAPWI